MRVLRQDGKQALSLEDAKALLEAAQSDYMQCNDVYQHAYRNRSESLQKLNDAQKAFDASVNDLRGFAPPESKWKSKSYPEEAAV